jgi:hypothetical protein
MRRKSLKENLKSLTPEQITEALKKAAEKAKSVVGNRPITSTVDLGLGDLDSATTVVEHSEATYAEARSHALR